MTAPGRHGGSRGAAGNGPPDLQLGAGRLSMWPKAHNQTRWAGSLTGPGRGVTAWIGKRRTRRALPTGARQMLGRDPSRSHPPPRVGRPEAGRALPVRETAGTIRRGETDTKVGGCCAPEKRTTASLELRCGRFTFPPAVRGGLGPGERRCGGRARARERRRGLVARPRDLQGSDQPPLRAPPSI